MNEIILLNTFFFTYNNKPINVLLSLTQLLFHQAWNHKWIRQKEMRKAGTAHTKSRNDVENHVHVKAKSSVSERFKLHTHLVIAS
uniref:Uncharacterized protein n=1 Tax=Salmo trutta TaxID=8032 RepID=A0A674BQU8_SALTR